MTPEQKKHWREEFEELNTLQFDNLSQYEREEKIYLTACKKRQEEIDSLRKEYTGSCIEHSYKEIQKLRELIKEAKILLTQNTHKLSQEQWLSDVNKVEL